MASEPEVLLNLTKGLINNSSTNKTMVQTFGFFKWNAVTLLKMAWNTNPINYLYTSISCLVCSPISYVYTPASLHACKQLAYFTSILGESAGQVAADAIARQILQIQYFTGNFTNAVYLTASGIRTINSLVSIGGSVFQKNDLTVKLACDAFVGTVSIIECGVALTDFRYTDRLPFLKLVPAEKVMLRLAGSTGRALQKFEKNKNREINILDLVNLVVV
jgi:hypothetical protein